MIAFVSNPKCVEHLTAPRHPERPDRLRAIHRAVRAAGIIRSPDPFPEFEIDLGPMAPAGFRAEEIVPGPADEKVIELVHSREYIERIKHVCASGGGVLDQGDTPVGAGSFDAALLSLGGVIEACDAVMSGRVKRAFAAGRPPGHHAEPDRPMGFCLFSNIAIGARYIQQKYSMARIAIVDFDVHHGNGTQAVFEADPSVYFVSMHENPRTCYPGSGYDWEIGIVDGRGSTLNVTFEPGADDDDYLKALSAKVVPALDAYRPEVLMISAGFDAHHDDPLAHIELSEEGFGAITSELVGLANRQCGGRIVSVLEGGYHLRALGRSVVKHLTALSRD